MFQEAVLSRTGVPQLTVLAALHQVPGTRSDWSVEALEKVGCAHCTDEKLASSDRGHHTRVSSFGGPQPAGRGIQM